MSPTFENRFGRRPGRGWRPWVLLPKVVCVGIAVGSLAAVVLLWFSSGFARLDPADPRRLQTLETIGILVRVLVVPGLMLAVIFGLVLLLQHPRQFIRLRWLQVKLVTVIVALPASHLFLYSRSLKLRDAIDRRLPADALAAQYAWGFVVVLIIVIGIIVLGRLKPRLRQNWARTFASIRKP